MGKENDATRERGHHRGRQQAHGKRKNNHVHHTIVEVCVLGRGWEVQGQWFVLIIPAVRKLRQGDCHELETSR